LTYTFPLLNAKVGPAFTFWLYACICALGFLFVWRKVPETKGKSLEQLESTWGIPEARASSVPAAQTRLT